MNSPRTASPQPTPTLTPTPASVARMRLAEMLVKTGEEDRAAFRELYMLTSAKLFGITYRICDERQAAEDVLHDVYLTIWKRAGAYEPSRSSPITWLATIARNRAIDWRRAQTTRRTTSLDNAPVIADSAPLPSETMVTDQDADLLHGCLDELEQRQSQVIRAAFFDGFTYAELAKQQNVPLGTMKSLIRRTLARLKTCLER